MFPQKFNLNIFNTYFPKFNLQFYNFNLNILEISLKFNPLLNISPLTFQMFPTRKNRRGEAFGDILPPKIFVLTWKSYSNLGHFTASKSSLSDVNTERYFVMCFLEISVLIWKCFKFLFKFRSLP